jgi:hypothetical protein
MQKALGASPTGAGVEDKKYELFYPLSVDSSRDEFAVYLKDTHKKKLF